MNVIEINNITKDYGKNKGVFDLSFQVQKGEVFGYLGPNGSGKTVTIRHLLGFIKAEQGTCTIHNMDCRTEAATIQKSLGFLPGEIAFFDDMTGMQFLKFMASMRKMTDFSKMEQLISFFELDPHGKIKKMSKGTKQKIALVCAFMHDPQVLILDEPTSGLDPLMQNKFIELILQEKARGKTILMSSHSFEEVERTCDRIGIIRAGRLVAVETVAALKRAQRKTYIVTFDNNNSASLFAEENIHVVSIHNNVVHVVVHGEMNAFIAAMAKYDVVSIDVETSNLEDLFLQFYGGEGQ